MIDSMKIPYWFPTHPMMFKGNNWGDTWRAGVHFGITHVHHFYTRKSLYILSFLINHSNNLEQSTDKGKAYLQVLMDDFDSR